MARARRYNIILCEVLELGCRCSCLLKLDETIIKIMGASKTMQFIDEATGAKLRLFIYLGKMQNIDEPRRMCINVK